MKHSKISFHIERLNKKNLTVREANNMNRNFIINNSNGSKTKLNNIIKKNYNDF